MYDDVCSYTNIRRRVTGARELRINTRSMHAYDSSPGPPMAHDEWISIFGFSSFNSSHLFMNLHVIVAFFSRCGRYSYVVRRERTKKRRKTILETVSFFYSQLDVRKNRLYNVKTLVW